MKIRSKKKKMRLFSIRGAFFVFLGASLAYLLDPESGEKRRAQTKNTAMTMVKQQAQDMDVKIPSQIQDKLPDPIKEKIPSNFKSNSSSEPAGQASTFMTGDKPSSVVLDQVRQAMSQLSFPTNEVEVNVEQKVVILRGQLKDPAQIKELERKVCTVSGIERVESYLHLPNTPAPNKAASIEASSIS